MAKVNRQLKPASDTMLQLFIGIWNRIQKEAIPNPPINEEMRLLRLEQLRLQHEKKLLSIRQEQNHITERGGQLSRCIFFLEQVRLEPMLLGKPAVAHKIDNHCLKAKKEWQSLDNCGSEYAELEIRHLIEKISLLQSLENKIKRNNF